MFYIYIYIYIYIFFLSTENNVKLWLHTQKCGYKNNMYLRVNDTGTGASYHTGLVVKKLVT